MRNTPLACSSVCSAVLAMIARTVGFVFLFSLTFPLHAPAQDFIPEKFDQELIEETLRDQEILREEMLLDQEILREEMEQIRLEIQRIMKEITLMMKGEALKLKAELEGLKEETQRIQREILVTLEKSKQDFLAGKEEMQRELKKMRQEAKILTTEIKEVLEDQRAVWQQETVALQGSLVEARKEMNTAKVNSEDVLKSSRSAIRKFQKEKIVTMAVSQSKSNAAMLDARITLKQSQNEYKHDSASINAELKADMEETRDAMQSRRKAQNRRSKNAQQEVLAALKTAKKQRLAELKQDLTRKKVPKRKVQKRKVQKRKVVKITKKQIRKKKRPKKVATRKVRVARAKVKTVDRRKAKKPIKKKPAIKQPPLIVRDDSTLQDIQEDKELEPVESKLAVAAIKIPEGLAQEKISRVSKSITNLKKELKKESGNPGALLAKLGDAYLEAQRFMDSQTDDKERQKLFDLSENQDLLLGSYEQAAWAYKLSLNFNHKSAETHLKIGKIYDEMEDGKNALMHAKLAHQIFKKQGNSSQMEEAQAFIAVLTDKYESASGKKTVHSG